MKATRRRFAAAIGAVLSTLVLAGCRSDAMWTQRDSWYTGRPPETSVSSWEPVPEDQYFPVDAERSSSAERLLRDVSFLAIDAAQLSRLASHPPAIPPDHRAYLVRGVLLNEHTGGFSLWAAGDRLLVSHQSLGRSPVPMLRRPLVAYLPRPPSEVFVVCGMDE